MNNCYVGLDVGTQGTKAIAYHPAIGKVVSRASYPYGLAPNDNNVKGRAEQDPAIWLQAVQSCLEKVMKDLSSKGYNVAGIGVSGQQHGMVALSSELKPLRLAKLWCDVEAEEQAAQFTKQATNKLKRPWNTPAGFTAPKILWFKQNEPDLFSKTKWFVLPHDYVTAKLAGNIIPTTDAGDASGSGLWDASTGQYLLEVAQLLDKDLYDKLPVALGPDAIAGYLSSEYATDILGLPKDHDPIPISVGSGDNICSALGVGCVVPGRAVLSLGTSGTIFGVSSTPVVQSEASVVAPFQDATGKHLPLVCIMSCTGVLQTVLDEWCNGMSHQEATELAQQVPSGCNGVTFLPYLGGERTPNWPNASGALLGLTASNMNGRNRVGLLYRAAMEGITFVLKGALGQLQQACGDDELKHLTTLYVVGGGSQNTLWRQMLSDVLHVVLKFPQESESAALGASFQAAAAAKHVPIDQFVLEQPIDMEDVIITPTTNVTILNAYQDALRRYESLSTKLFAT